MTGRKYKEEEKQAYIEEFKCSGKPLLRYASEKGIPESTLRTWLRAERELTFGSIDLSSHRTLQETSISSTIFETEKIKIELKENYDKKLLKKIVEVLVNQ